MAHLMPLQLGLPGGPELLIILFIAILLFGANKIPKLARSSGEAIGEFQKGRVELEKELEEMKQGNSVGTDDTGQHGEGYGEGVSKSGTGEETHRTKQAEAGSVQSTERTE